MFSSQNYTVNCRRPEFSVLQKLQEKSHKLKFHVAFYATWNFLEFNFCGCLYHAGLQCLLCCRSIWQGYPRMALGGGNRGIKGSLLPSTCLGSLLASKMCPCYGPLVKLWFAFLACCNRSTVWCHMPLNSRLMSLPFVHHAYTCTLGLP